MGTCYNLCKNEINSNALSINKYDLNNDLDKEKINDN